MRDGNRRDKKGKEKGWEERVGEKVEKRESHLKDTDHVLESKSDRLAIIKPNCDSSLYSSIVYCSVY